MRAFCGCTCVCCSALRCVGGVRCVGASKGDEVDDARTVAWGKRGRGEQSMLLALRVRRAVQSSSMTKAASKSTVSALLLMKRRKQRPARRWCGEGKQRKDQTARQTTPLVSLGSARPLQPTATRPNSTICAGQTASVRAQRSISQWPPISGHLEDRKGGAANRTVQRQEDAW